MKRSKIILGVLILSVMALVLSGCGEENLITLPPLEENDTYALGDIGPAGGYIFYDKGSSSDGWRYLEAAPASTETSKLWGTFGTWIGGTETGIGTGQSNTTTILTCLDSAAQFCDVLVYGGYCDWFLPSKDELNLMRENLYLEGVGGFAYYSCCWSSSEASAYYAWLQVFFNGHQSGHSKDASSQVRAVRAF